MMKSNFRTRAFGAALVLSVLMATATASPASAATWFGDTEGKYFCGGWAYSVITGEYTKDGSAKVDLHDLSVGGRVSRPGSCTPVTKICLDFSIHLDGAGKLGITASDRFGSIASAFQSKSGPYYSASSNDAWVTFSKCRSGLNTRIATINYKESLESLTTRPSRLDDFTLKSRIRFWTSNSSAVNSTPWSSVYVDL